MLVTSIFILAVIAAVVATAINRKKEISEAPKMSATPAPKQEAVKPTLIEKAAKAEVLVKEVVEAVKKEKEKVKVVKKAPTEPAKTEKKPSKKKK